jgi:hypothetical protein
MGKLIMDDDFALILIVPLPLTYDELLELFTTSADIVTTTTMDPIVQG